MRIWDMIKSLFATTCGDCQYHSGNTTCYKLKGIVSKDNPKCGRFKPRKKHKKRRRK